MFHLLFLFMYCLEYLSLKYHLKLKKCGEFSNKNVLRTEEKKKRYIPETDNVLNIVFLGFYPIKMIEYRFLF